MNNYRLTPVDLEKDLPEINSWYRKRDLAPLKKNLVPPQGFIVSGIGAGFMIRTNTGLAFLEYFITNPESSRNDRILVLDLIAGALIAAGKSSGVTAFFALTKHSAIEKLCAKYQFIEIKDMKVFGRI